MAYEIKGTVKTVGDEQKITDKFSKREIVIEHGDKYPQWNSFEAVNDRMSLLGDVRVGDTVTIWFDLSGREPKNNGRVFNSNRIWKMQVDAKAAAHSSGGVGFTGDIPF